MKIPAAQPITAAQSRASRFQLGLTQSEVIDQSGLAGYKLKQFETGRFIPDMPFLQKLADFYTSKGIELDDIKETSNDFPAQNTATAKPGGNKVTLVQRPCFYISDTISPDLLDRCLERMHANDQRIAEILNKEIRNGMFGGYHEETVQEHQELFGAMAEGYLIFRLLQGNPIVPPVEGGSDPKSHADLLSQFYAQSPISQADTQQVSTQADEVEA
jgi:transcriptional regulator with XRE-family HTH domain